MSGSSGNTGFSTVAAFLIGAAGAISLVALLLLFQNARGEWPFSSNNTQSPPPEPRSAEVSEDHNHGRIDIEADVVWLDRLGVRTEPVLRENISRGVRAVATVAPDEERVSHIHTRVSGWIEELQVSTTGQAVEQGQALAAIFSQDLFAAQTEYLAVTPATGTGQISALQAGARQRLQVLGMSDSEIAEINASRQPRYRVSINAPNSGIVLRRGVSVGTAVDPSTELMTIVDLSHVWILAELPEQDIPLALQGAQVQVDIPASGLAPFPARIDFIYPTLSERTRSLRVRILVPNPERVLRPGMSGTVSFQGESRIALTVPRDAMVDTGQMQHVFVQTGPGRFEPRPVRVGLRLPERIEILEGLEEGEEIVTSGVFLVDSESRLRGSGGAGHAGHGTPQDRQAPAQEPSASADQHQDHN
jgi:membrane fusion protein, copper/silver efflux system